MVGCVTWNGKNNNEVNLMASDLANSLPQNKSSLADDGLPTPTIKIHSLEKLRIIEYLASLFSRATQKKWQCRVYIDLFSCAGRATISRQGKIVNTSALLALGIQPPFEKYIFCEKDSQFMSSLAARVNELHPGADIKFIPGDCNEKVEEIIKAIPQYSKSYHVLSFCLIDPFRASDFHFETIRKLSQFFIDFLVLIPDQMDIGRWWKKYLDPKNQIIENFLGNTEWREQWVIWSHEQKRAGRPGSFSIFALEQFIKQMESLEFKSLKPSSMKQVRQAGNRSPLYKLALFSKHELGLYLFDQTQKYTEPQMKFNFSPIKTGEDRAESNLRTKRKGKRIFSPCL
jgi:three-Cys-motif partner protein